MYILILLVYAGPWAHGDSVALTTISDFTSEHQCMEAGQKAAAMTKDSAKETRYVCVLRSK